MTGSVCLECGGVLLSVGDEISRILTEIRDEFCAMASSETPTFSWTRHRLAGRAFPRRISPIFLGVRFFLFGEGRGNTSKKPANGRRGDSRHTRGELDAKAKANAVEKSLENVGFTGFGRNLVVRFGIAFLLPTPNEIQFEEKYKTFELLMVSSIGRAQLGPEESPNKSAPSSA